MSQSVTSNAIALEWQEGQLTYAALSEQVTRVSEWLNTREETRFALIADNSPAWIIIDLACKETDKILIPIPLYFSVSQTEHVFLKAEVEIVFAQHIPDEAVDENLGFSVHDIRTYKRNTSGTPDIPAGTGKITFTSGSTGEPKGVCLSDVSQDNVAKNLVSAINLPAAKHLCLLPLPTLLENIAGVYAPLLCHGTVVVRSAEQLGFSGASLSEPARLLHQIDTVQPDTLILVPELLLLLVNACINGWVAPGSLKFVAVGGAHTDHDLIEKARAFGLPVYQGYGLSEGVSVTTLNLPGQDEPHSVGKVLGHTHLESCNGELVVSGSVFLGYLNNPASFYPDKVVTGDLATCSNGFYFVKGRKKNIIVSSLGRNISPEWIESRLYATGLFRGVLLAGEGQPFCTAVLIPRGSPERSKIAQAITAINQTLPDYARVKNWRLADCSHAPHTLFTPNGKLRRVDALRYFKPLIDDMYTAGVPAGESYEFL